MKLAEIILAVFARLTICFGAAFIETWWEQRKWDKENRGKR